MPWGRVPKYQAYASMQQPANPPNAIWKAVAVPKPVFDRQSMAGPKPRRKPNTPETTTKLNPESARSGNDTGWAWAMSGWLNVPKAPETQQGTERQTDAWLLSKATDTSSKTLQGAPYAIKHPARTPGRAKAHMTLTHDRDATSMPQMMCGGL